ncbi:hypothetical protein NQ317_017164 [Molorchus minor]|uniref:DNA-directed RNA polymerase subunit n=1 Tax=Molorchus minor TaxID=1323400 RepID=A0ABQ9J1C5_9CUCU|nr:hypothetical protein NQ317_017164 [Molorchus minor]
MNRSQKPAPIIHLVPENIQFSLFTAQDIKKLCIMKIVTPLTLDALGHPLPGGLYDPRLGPLSDKSPPCGTCNKTMTNCPGHFGYIELPFALHVKDCMTLQMKLLNGGRVTEALDVATRISQLIAEFGDYQHIPPDQMHHIIKYETLANETLGELDGKYDLSQNTEFIRNDLLSQLLKEASVGKQCQFCKSEINKVQVLKNRIIVSTRRSSGVTVLESKYMNPEESRAHMKKIWRAEKEFLQQFISVLTDIEGENPTDALYMDIIPVPPPCVRPMNMLGDRFMEHKQTIAYKTVLQNVILLKAIIQVVQKKGDQNSLSSGEAKAAYSYARGNTPVEKLNYAWEELQNDVDCLVDRESTNGRESEGLKQIIEKKEGIIRMNMMGKRVNYSARSVITPDPNLNIDEIGVPEEFAKKLTYPVAVTPWNVEELRKMIMNGPNVHPGAVMVEYDGMMKRINPNNITQQKSILKCLLTPDDKGKSLHNVKRVYRHLCNGDILLLNRQPTLHKPSIMAHKARILKGEKTFRLHYANCKAYNADFDGDEMNAHFPQNEVARSEGYNIVNVSNQYLVPKDGTPLSGLIQDHMIAGVRLSLRGRFFNKVDYQQLVFQALGDKTSQIVLLPPAIMKPKRLWSGKQILSTVIINIIPAGRERINLTATAKIPSKAWQTGKARNWKAGGAPFENANTMSEAEVIIRGGELLVGILDKMHYGATPYGLVHCIYEWEIWGIRWEIWGKRVGNVRKSLGKTCLPIPDNLDAPFQLYGDSCATKLLSSFGKLFMSFLQQEGFTLGVHDILTVKRADRKRSEIIRKSREIGQEVVTTALDLPLDTPPERVVEVIEETNATNPKIRATIDRHYKSALDSYTNDINKACLPAGLVCKFPHNNLQLMVMSGAKGSTVNTMQISCLLGQIELEGKRPPVMISGKSLPSFPAFEFSPRAGGIHRRQVHDRDTAAGVLLPLHGWEGGENHWEIGLIDTAVKTSRSGYLQRCLIKHLEGLHVGYDMTVRNSDKSVIQFLYGEDGMDISKAQFFNEKQLQFLSEEHQGSCAGRRTERAEERRGVQRCESSPEESARVERNVRGPPETQTQESLYCVLQRVKDESQGFDKWQQEKRFSSCGGAWTQKPSKRITKMQKLCVEKCRPCPDPTHSVYQPDSHFGSINERLEKLMDGYQQRVKLKRKKEFEGTMKLKAMQSMCAPGEPVGLLAAQITFCRFQSIGEPSTQMTLNTFHFAGRGEMNVTLGIPRLREILMMASKNIKTPSMEIPFLDVPDLENRAERLRRMLTRVCVADVLEKIEVDVELQLQPVRQHKYTLRFEFLPEKCYRKDYHVKPREIVQYMKRKFFGEMFQAILRFAKVKTNLVTIGGEQKKRRNANNDGDDNGGEEDQDKDATGGADDPSSSEDEIEDEEDAKVTNKFKDVREAQEPEAEEKEESDEDEAEGGDQSKQDRKQRIEDEVMSDDENAEGGNKSASRKLEPAAEEENTSGEDSSEGQTEPAKGNKSKRKVDSEAGMHRLAEDFRVDEKKFMWCEISFALPLTFKKTGFVRAPEGSRCEIGDVADDEHKARHNLHEKRRVDLENGRDKHSVCTSQEMFKYHGLLDIDKLYCNDIHKVAQTYGIEAASKIIVKEVKDVFNVYGIKVDPRHLSLIADYMTFSGSFEPLSRKGMESSASPLQQISFESSLTFLRNSTIRDAKPRSCCVKKDDLHNPSSALMIGRPCSTGTGCFSLRYANPL